MTHYRVVPDSPPSPTWVERAWRFTRRWVSIVAHTVLAYHILRVIIYYATYP